ncbi:UNVERIFIED_CONTAM: Polb [Trichonephila clavipes]
MTSKRKATASEGPNSAFCEFLLELADYEKNVSRNIHKYKAYSTAASSLAHHPVKIKSGKEALALKGVGKKIADKIDEFIDTGKLEKLEKVCFKGIYLFYRYVLKVFIIFMSILVSAQTFNEFFYLFSTSQIRKDDTSQAINLLTKVVGIGPAAAQKFVKEGIMTIEDLKKNINKLNHQQKIGLKYFEDFEKKIPRAEMQELEKKFLNICHTVDEKYVVTICGSYRRGAAESGDIDILLTHPRYSSLDSKQPDLMKRVVTRLEKEGLITDTIMLGESKFMGVCRLEEGYTFRRIDIRVFPNDQYYCATLYFTGSGLFNQQMRAHAVEQGFTINEYSIRPIGSRGTPGEPLEVTSERDIFEYINYPYKEPHERNV